MDLAEHPVDGCIREIFEEWTPDAELPDELADAALDLLDEARQGYVKTAVPMLQPVEAHKARVYLKQGRLDKAQAWVRERSISTQDKVRYLDEYEHLTLARVRLTEGFFAGVNDLPTGAASTASAAILGRWRKCRLHGHLVARK